MIIGAYKMLQEIGSYDAKTKLPEILRRVETGESFTITNRGRPMPISFQALRMIDSKQKLQYRIY